GRLLSEVVSARQEAKESKELTKAQKKFLSNVQKDIETFKREVKAFEKGEIKTLEKDLKKTEAAMQKDIQKLENSSSKVDSLAKIPQFGRSNFIFGVSKEFRAKSASKEAMQAKVLEAKASTDTATLQGRAENTQNKISQLQSDSHLLSDRIQTRMTTLKDVHASIANAKAERERLVEKYEYRKEEFANFKTPSKMNSIDKQSFKDELGKFDKQIQSFEKLEKKLGKQGIKKEEEEKLLEDVNKELALIKQETGKISSAILSVIKNSEHNHMNFSERISLASSRFFSSNSKEKFNKQELQFFEKEYPGIDPKVAFKMHEESLKKETLKNKGEKTGAEQLPPEFDGPPTDLPPDLETYILQQAAKLPPELGGPPTDLPPELPKTTENQTTTRPIRARYLPGNNQRFNALNPENPPLDT
ncbi:MAG TPA: hypothetical protein PLC42_07955, partial [Parachlamydiaceae bacterium]|nr:hypothetical protein [Parachlamydiaceae bacterium]